MKKVLLFSMMIMLITLVPVQTAQARFIPTHFMVLRIGLAERFSARASIDLRNTAIFYGHNYLQSTSGGFTVRPYGSHQAALYDGSLRVRVLDASTQVRDAYGGFIWLEGIAYRGAVEFIRTGGHSITAVNILSIEEYLFSVVPSEMPASWHIEALKAQSVAARTYALHALERGSTHVGFDLCDRVHCQVYRGVEWEHENSTQAVLATAGLAAYFAGELIDAVYFASSGGFTENSENVWLEARPYLRSMPDPHEFEPVIWTRAFSLVELTSLLAQNNHHIGSATGMTIGSTHPSGRVESLVIHGATGQVVLTREEIRTFFSPSPDGSLHSRNFVIGGGHIMPSANVSIFDGLQTFEVLPHGLYGVDSQRTPMIMGDFSIFGTNAHQPVTASGDTIMLSGSGFGHGVGMSQRGAEGMARRGYTFREILAHFYTGITIE